MSDTPSTEIKVSREEVYKIAQEIGGEIADKILAGKEAGDKMLHDHGEERIVEILVSRNEAKRHHKMQKAAIMGQFALCALKGIKGGGQSAAMDAANKQGDETVTKLIQASDFSGGGAVLPDGFTAEVVEFLRSKAIVRSLGARTKDMVNDTDTIPYIQTGAAAGYVGEGSAPNATTLEFGQLQLTAKKIVAIVPISNDWLRSEGAMDVGGATLIGEDLGRAVAVTEDRAFIRGTGAGGAPKGMRWLAIPANVKAQTKAGATVTVAEATYDLTRLQYLQMAQDVDIDDGAYLISPRTWLALASARDGNNNLIWSPEMAAGTLLGQQFDSTTSVPDNLGSGSDSEIIFASMAYAIIGESLTMMMELLENPAYVDASGSIKSGASQDESAMRVISKNDFGGRHRGKEFSVITGVDWTKLA